MTERWGALSSVALAAGVLWACSSSPSVVNTASEDIKKLLSEANNQLLVFGNRANRAAWIQDTFITVDTQQAASDANEAYLSLATSLARRAGRLSGSAGDEIDRRQLALLKR